MDDGIDSNAKHQRIVVDGFLLDLLTSDSYGRSLDVDVETLWPVDKYEQKCIRT